MDKLTSLAQYLGVLLLVSGAGPLGIAVFGSFVIEPSPMELAAFGRETVQRTRDLFIYRQVLDLRYDNHLSGADKRKIFCDTTSLFRDHPEIPRDPFLKSSACKLREFKGRLRRDPVFAMDMYHQYYDWRGPDAGGIAFRGCDERYQQGCADVGLQDQDRIFFEEQRQRTARLRPRYMLLGTVMVAAGCGLCLWGWSHK